MPSGRRRKASTQAPKEKTFEDYHLTVLDRDVLETLTQARVFRSVVYLAESMWQGHERQLGADPVWLVQTIVEDLSEKGLVIYRLSEQRHFIDTRTTSGIALSIRLSSEGWRIMGFPTLHAQVFSRLSTSRTEEPIGDLTQFRKHHPTASGGEIEIDTFAEHREKFPQHVHMYGGEDEEDMAARPYTKVTEKLEGEVIALKTISPTASNAEIAEALQIPTRTVTYILNELPKLRRVWDESKADASLKRRIVWALEEMDFNNVTDLRRVLGRADDAHNIVHVLHSLRKEEYVTFTEGKDAKEPQNIHLTGRGRTSAEKRRQMTLVSPIRDEAVEEGYDAAKAVIHNASEPAGYPELDALLAREQERQSKDSNGYKLLQAAELIKDINPTAAAQLEAEAAEVSLPYPSPVEAEYMRYVAEHPNDPS